MNRTRIHEVCRITVNPAGNPQKRIEKELIAAFAAKIAIGTLIIDLIFNLVL